MSANHAESRPVQRRRRGGGFTLVEVLVVVGVLVLIVSILVPVVSRARGQAARTQCANTLRRLGEAVVAFEGEHNSTLPTCGLDKPTYPTSTDWIGYGGMDTNNKTDYMSECGLAKYLGTGSPDKNNVVNQRLRSYYHCPSVTDDQRSSWKFPYDYVFNAQLSGMPIERVQKASEKGMIVESDKQDDSAYTWWTGEGVAARHIAGSGNCLFADGHVDLMSTSHNGDFTYWDAYYTPATGSTAAAQVQPKNGGYGAAQ